MRRLTLIGLGLATLAQVPFAVGAWRFTHLGHRNRELGAGLEVQTATKDGLARHIVAGSEPGTVFCFAGYGGDAAHLTAQAAWFHARGWSVVAVDFRGTGASEGDAVTIGWDEAAQVREAVADATGPVVLYGLSMGAAAILRAVGDLGVRADALVLENPYDRLRTTVGHRIEARGLPVEPITTLLLGWGSLELGYDAFAMNPVESAAQVTVPTLLLDGADDAYVRGDEIRAIDAALQGPHSLVFVPGAKHQGLFAFPETWVPAVDAFLARTFPDRR